MQKQLYVEKKNKRCRIFQKVKYKYLFKSKPKAILTIVEFFY